MNHNARIKYIRDIASGVGLSFRAMKKYKNDKPQYDFIDKKSRKVVIEWVTLDKAFEDICNGYIESYDSITGTFKGD